MKPVLPITVFSSLFFIFLASCGIRQAEGGTSGTGRTIGTGKTSVTGTTRGTGGTSGTRRTGATSVTGATGGTSGTGRTIGTSADIQALIDSKVAQADGHPATITLKGGTYCLTDMICLDGVSDLVIEGEEGKEVLLRGDVDVTGWKRSDVAPGALVADISGMHDLGDVIGRDNRIDLYSNGKRQTVSRWPDKGFTCAGLALGSREVGDTWIHKHGTFDGLIEYVDKRIGRWKDEDDPRFHGYWYWDWCEDNSMRPETIDTVRRTIQFKTPLHVYGYRDSCRFYGFNLLCELDSEGEYYINRTDSLIYWIPAAGTAPRKAKARLSEYSEPYAFSFVGCRNVTLRNVHIRGTRRGGIFIKGGENVSIEDCHLQDLGDFAVDVDGGRGHRILRSVAEELGFGGFSLKGGDRRTLSPSGFVVSDNIVRNFSLFKRTYQPAVHFEGAGIEISHNLFQGSSSSALRIEGNDVDISYNQIFDVVNESDDQGGLDSYFDYSFRRIVLYRNHWRDIRGGMFAGAAAIRFDDMVSGHIVRGNVFERCGGGCFGGVQINGGKDNVIEENVFYDCPWAVSCTEWSPGWWRERFVEQEKKMQAVGGWSELYLSRYPELKNPSDADLNVNYVRKNLVVGAKALLREANSFVEEDNTMKGGLDVPLATYLSPDTLTCYGIPPIPFSQIGPRTR